MKNDNDDYWRAMPLCDEFMSYRIDDAIYSYLLVKSTYGRNYLNAEFLNVSYENLISYKRELADILNTTQRTITNRLNDLIEEGFIEKTCLDKDGTRIVYKINRIQDINPKWLYQKIDISVLNELINIYKLYNKQRKGKNVFSNMIKIYAYLYGKYSFFKDKDPNYSFTYKELAHLLGYSDNSKTGIDKVKEMLDLLSCNHWIKYVNYTDTLIVNENPVPVPKKRLIKVEDDTRMVNCINPKIW